MSNIYCVLHYLQGYSYAGVQSSSYCFCGNSYGKYGSSAACSKQCAGDANQICGGHWSNTIMRLGGMYL